MIKAIYVDTTRNDTFKKLCQRDLESKIILKDLKHYDFELVFGYNDSIAIKVIKPDDLEFMNEHRLKGFLKANIDKKLFLLETYKETIHMGLLRLRFGIPTRTFFEVDLADVIEYFILEGFCID